MIRTELSENMASRNRNSVTGHKTSTLDIKVLYSLCLFFSFILRLKVKGYREKIGATS